MSGNSAQILTRNPTATTIDGIAWVHELCVELHTGIVKLWSYDRGLRGGC